MIAKRKYLCAKSIGPYFKKSSKQGFLPLYREYSQRIISFVERFDTYTYFENIYLTRGFIHIMYSNLTAEIPAIGFQRVKNSYDLISNVY